MSWLPAIIGVLAGACIASSTQIWLFYYSARKERLFRIREALADFGAAGFAYLDAQENLAAFVQRQMNMPVGGQLPSSRMSQDTQKEWQRQDDLLADREREAGKSYWTHRQKLQECKARLFVLTDDRDIQQRTAAMWQRLLDMQPSRPAEQPSDPVTNPQFATVQIMRAELDQWLSETAALIPNLFR